MHKRFTLVAGLAALVAIAIPASAALAGETVTGPDGNTQSIEASVAPKALLQEDGLPGGPERRGQNRAPRPRAACRARPSTTSSTSTRTSRWRRRACPPAIPRSLQNTTTEAAEQACGKAKIGSGSAITLLPTGSQVYTEPTKVTAFNGAPQGGKPVVLLHAYGSRTAADHPGPGRHRLQLRQGRLRAAPRRHRSRRSRAARA